MATLSARGLPQLANLFIRSRRLNPYRRKYQTLNLTYGRVLSLHYNFQRNCSTVSNNKGSFIEELNEDADDLSTVSQNGDQHVESHEKPLEECRSNILSNGRQSFQKVKSECFDGEEGENSLDSGQETHSKVLRGIGPTSDIEKERKSLVPDQPENAKILRISIIGAPNAGKSTLTNSLMNWKVSSVSNKVHTTRKNTLAVLTEEETQIIFLDTPGVLDPAKRKRHNLEANMVTDPKDSVAKADMIGVLVDVSDTWTRNALNKNVLKILHLNKHVPSILILNKVDLVKHKGVLLKLSHQLLNNTCGGKPLKSEVAQTDKELKLDDVISEYHAKSKEGLMKDDYFDDRNDRRDYNDRYDDVGRIPEKELQFFLSETRDKIDYYRQEKDEKRMLKSNSKNVLDDVRFRLTLLSVDVNPALNSVTQKLLMENDVDEQKLNRELENETGWSHFSNVFMVSAQQNDGIGELKDFLKGAAKPGDWQYHSSLVTDKSPQEVAISLVKEQVLEKLGFEIPYKITPKIQEWSMTSRGLSIVMRLEAQRDRDMKYLIGRKGSTINLIQERACQEIRNALRCEVYLHLKCECLERNM